MIATFILVVLFLGISIFGNLSSFSHGLGRPIWEVSNFFQEKINSYSYLLKSNKNLLRKNNLLKDRLIESQAKYSDREVLFDENIKLKEILSRNIEVGDKIILGNILTKPNRSLYDILIIDVGTENQIKAGDKVLAYGNVLIGEVAEVYSKSSKVKLYSTAGEKLGVILSGKDIFLEAIGRGGGNFEIKLSRGVEVEKGNGIIIPGIYPYLIATVEKIISDPRDPAQKILLRSPVNIQELKWIQVVQN